MAEEMKITSVSEISDEDVEALRRLTAYYLPQSPTGHGLKPGDIKALLWKAFVYGDHSVIGLLRRICEETNKAIEGTTTELEKYVDEAISEALKNIPTEVYAGEHIVTPMVDGQTLGTAKKIVQEDIVVEAIPYSEVSNETNGKTVTIG